MKTIIKTLTNQNKTIATMESCTGGALASAITNCYGASKVLNFSAITYSNDTKIMLGVDKKIIDTYTEYSINVANSMAFNITKIANSNYGIGITGKLEEDPNNNIVFISIYDKNNNKYYEYILYPKYDNRKANKEYIVNEIKMNLLTILDII